MYLTANITGTASQIIYGLKGDMVEVIEGRDDMSIVQDSDGNRFWVRDEFLSAAFVAPDDEEVTEEKATPNSKEPKKKAKPATQPNLF